MRKFYDIDHDKVWTEDELRKEHKRLIAEDFTEDEKEIYSDFDYWLQCCTDKNGSLDEIAPEYEIDNKRKWTALTIAAQTDLDYEDVLKVLRKWNVHGTQTMWEIINRPVDIEELAECVEKELLYKEEN